MLYRRSISRLKRIHLLLIAPYFLAIFSIVEVFFSFSTTPVFAAPPSITSVDVTASTVGTTVANTVTKARYTDTIRINGSNFSATCASNTVTVNGAAATPTTCSTTVLSGISVPYGTPTGNITEKVSQTATFAFTLMPEIDSLTPNKGGANETTTTIAGHDLTSVLAGSRSTATNNVKFNGTQAADGNITAWSDTSITVLVPTGTTTGTVVVTANSNASGAAGTNATFTIVSDPSITSVDVTASSVGTTIANGITGARVTDTIRLNGSNTH